jgi:hypothetical protein
MTAVIGAVLLNPKSVPIDFIKMTDQQGAESGLDIEA